MPQVEVVLFAEDDGTAPLLEWLDEQPEKVQDRCVERIDRLAELGHEMRRPLAAYLRDGIHELRVQRTHVNYRMLYFFHGGTAVISHGLIKEREVPGGEIELALRRKEQFESHPHGHTFRE